MANIFCINCKWFDSGERIPFSFGPPEFLRDRCLSDMNFRDSNVEPNILPISQPHIINRFNDCKWFEAIEIGSSSSSTSEPTDVDTIDYNVWTWRLVVLSESASGNDSNYVLPMRPKNENFVLLFINGVQTSNFTYDSDTNSVEFTDGNITEGYKITVYMMVRRAQINIT